MIEKSHTAGLWPSLYDPLRNFSQKVADWVAPRSDALALEDAYEINVELPGVKPEDVNVSVHDNSLTIRGEKQSAHEEKGRSYFFSEREFGAFQRTFRIPADADGDKIDATYGDGVLCLKIAKRTSKETASKTVKIRRH